MQNGTYPWMASSSLAQKSWPPGYQASLTDLFLKKNPLHFGTGISQLAAASNYIEKMSTMNDTVPPKCPHPDAKDKPYPCDICQQYLTLCNSLRNDGNSANTPRPTNNSPINEPPSDRKPMSLMPNTGPNDIVSTGGVHPAVNFNPGPPPGMQAVKPRPIPTKQFPCPVCHKLFTQKGNLKTHMMIHTGEKPYACQACGKSFTQKGNVDTHMKIHTGEREYGCEACGKRFTQKGNLKTHIRSVHTKEKPFACGLCGKCFSQKGNMQTHLRTHNKDDRFPCTLCGKTFSQKGNLKTHMARHAGQIPTKRQFGSRLANRTYVGQLGKVGPPTIPRLQPFPIQPSPVSSQASAPSPLNSPATPQPVPTQYNHPDLRSPPQGVGNPYSESPIDLKPPLNCHLPLSRPLSCGRPPGLCNSPGPQSPSPDEEPNSRLFVHAGKFFQNSSDVHSPGYASESLSDPQQHRNGPTPNPRITSPLPIGTPNRMQNHERDSRPFYSAPPTPVPAPATPVSRWLPPRHYDSFQTHGGLGCYGTLTPHTTPLSRLSLLASGSMNAQNNNSSSHHLENHNPQHQMEAHSNQQQHLENHIDTHNSHMEGHGGLIEPQQHHPNPMDARLEATPNHLESHPNHMDARNNHMEAHANNIDGHNQRLEDREEMEAKENDPVQQHPQEHFHSPNNPDFSQLLD